MAVEVARATLRGLQRSNGSFHVQVRSPDVDGVERALAAAAAGLLAIEHTDERDGTQVKFVSEPLWAPSGWLLYVDMPDAETWQLRRALEVLEASLVDAEVVDATIGEPSERGLMHAENRYAERHGGCGIAPGPTLLVVAERLPGQPSRPIPETWTDAAASWIAAEEPADVWFEVMAAAEFRIEPTRLREWFDRAPAYSFGARTGSLDHHVRKVMFRGDNEVRFAIVGPGPDRPATVEHFDELVELGRRLMADGNYAAVDIAASSAGAGNDPRYEHRWGDPTFDPDRYPMELLSPFPMGRLRGWSDDGPLPRPEPWPWQRIGAESARAFSRLPDEAVRFADGQVELRFGDLAAWIERSDTLPVVVQRGRAALGPLRNIRRSR